MKVLGTSKISKILRVTLPREVADRLGANDGDFVTYLESEKPGEVIIRKTK